MKKRYDATMRNLFEPGPAAWMEFFGVPVPDPKLAEILDSNVSTVSAETDKLLRRGGPDPVILHIEFLSGRDTRYPRKAFWYNTHASRTYDEPVWSVLMLLRPAADAPDLTGEYHREFPGRGRHVWFRYDVVRVWELPPDRLLKAGLPLLPLAPVSNVAPEQLHGVLTAVAERLRDEAQPEVKATLWAATEVLLGLYHPEERVHELIGEITTMILGIPGIEESSVYQGIFHKGKAEGKAEGRAEEARMILLSLGRRQLGQPDQQVLDRIAAIADPDRLHALIPRLFDVTTWDELLASADQ
jgi:predicted transposase YdaD